MMGNLKLWLKVVDRSDESLIAWLQTVASSICLHIFQLKQEEEEEEEGRLRLKGRSWGVVNLLAGHLFPPYKNMACILQRITDEARIQKTDLQWYDIQQLTYM